MEPKKSYEALLAENEELRWQLTEAQDTIEAIRSGQVDALIVNNDDGPQLYTLKSADQTYRVFIEKMNEGAVTLNHAGIILYSNSRFATMTGLPLEKVIGLNFETFVSMSSVGEFNTLIGNGWEKDCKGEIILQNVSKRLIPCLLSCNTLELDEGTSLSLILTDLSVQKESQLKLEQRNTQLADAQDQYKRLNDELEATVKIRTKDLQISREHLKLLTDYLPQMTWTNLPNGEVNFYNQRWYDYTGVDYEVSHRSGWREVVHPDDLQNTLEKFTLSLQTGRIFDVENRYKQFDGTYRWHLNRAVPLKNDDDEILFWVGTATDIEEQKLEMERKDEFIGIASHELKTPLTSLKGYLQIMEMYKKEPLPAAIRQYISKAITALNKLQNLVNDLLDVSKIQAGRLDYQVDRFDMADMLKAAAENAQHIYPEYHFESHIDNGLQVEGNAERLEQVLMNMISNAVKYTKDNKNVIIKASAASDRVRVSVTDFGIGLSNEQKDKIFERFYRVEDTQFLTSGLGMGLYISSQIINNHHGSIGVNSELNNGATFYFELPLV